MGQRGENRLYKRNNNLYNEPLKTKITGIRICSVKVNKLKANHNQYLSPEHNYL